MSSVRRAPLTGSRPETDPKKQQQPQSQHSSLSWRNASSTVEHRTSSLRDQQPLYREPTQSTNQQQQPPQTRTLSSRQPFSSGAGGNPNFSSFSNSNSFRSGHSQTVLRRADHQNQISKSSSSSRGGAGDSGAFAPTPASAAVRGSAAQAASLAGGAAAAAAAAAGLPQPTQFIVSRNPGAHGGQADDFTASSTSLAPASGSVSSSSIAPPFGKLNSFNLPAYQQGQDLFPTSTVSQTDKSVRSAFSSGQRSKWMPPSIATSKNVPRASDEERNQAIFRKVRGILNKITPDKFDKLSEQLVGLGLDTAALLKGVILLIFEKALEEPKYSSMYAQLCSKLSQQLPNFEALPGSNPQPSGQLNNEVATNTFCRLLLIKCSNEFENRRKATESYGDEPLPDEDEEARSMAKSKMLGNIKFICELGRQLLVHESILHTCIKELCSKRRNEKVQNKAQDLECLCQIMKTVGRLLDREKAKQLMDQYFDRIEQFARNIELPSRIVFMLLDVIELRRNKWVPRRVQREAAANPRTIGQIREEAARDFGYMPAMSMPFGQTAAMSSASGGYGDFTSHYANFSANNSNQQGLNNLRSPLYGHPGMPLQVGRPGQRALDDMGYYANLSQSRGQNGPGVVREDNFAGLGHNEGRDRDRRRGERDRLQHPSPSPSPPQLHVQGHMPYRGSNSQGTRRGGERDNSNMQRQIANNRQQQQQQQRGSDVGQEMAPRFRKGNQGGQVSQNLGGQGRTGSLPMNTSLKPMIPSAFSTGLDGEISLRPAQNSMVVTPLPVFAKNQGSGLNENVKGSSERSSPMLIKSPTSSRSSPTSSIDHTTSANNAKNSSGEQNSREILLKRAEEAVSDLGNSTIEEVVAKMKGLKIPKNLQTDFLVTLFKSAVEKSDQEREAASKMLTKMKNENVIGAHVFVAAFKSLLTKIGDIESEVPRVKSHLAGFIGRAVIDDIIDLVEAKDLVADYYPMFMLVLQQVTTIQGQSYVMEQLNSNKIKLMDLLPEADRNKQQLADILRERELSFVYPLLRIELDLLKLTSGPDVTANGLYRWIKDSVDTQLQGSAGFVKVLFTAVAKHVIEKSKQIAAETSSAADNNNENSSSQSSPGATGTLGDIEKDQLAKFTGVLNAFFNERPDLQLIALYSLQSLCHELGFPKGMLLRWFIALYDLEVVEEDAFLKWKEDLNDEFQGKGQALFQVNSWLTWLAEAEESEEDDEEEGVSAE